jgi:hypothetical protein
MSGGKRTNLINTFAGIKVVGSAKVAGDYHLGTCGQCCIRCGVITVSATLRCP